MAVLSNYKTNYKKCLTNLLETVIMKQKDLNMWLKEFTHDEKILESLK